MKKAIGLCVLAMFLSASAYGTAYDWSSAVTLSYDCATGWTGGLVPADYNNILGTNHTITKGTGAGRVNMAGSYYMGELTVNNGALAGSFGSGLINLYVLDDCGLSGNFTVSGTGVMNDATGSMWFIDGNVSIRSGGIDGNTKQFRTTLTLQGAGKTFEDCDTALWNRVIIAAGASISTAASGNGATLRARSLDVNGTFSSGTANVHFVSLASGTPSRVGIGPSGLFSPGTTLRVKPTGVEVTGAGNTVVWGTLGGGAYGNLVSDTSEVSSGTTGNYRSRVAILGDIACANNFAWGGYTGNNVINRTMDVVLNTDNGLGGIADVAVDGRFQLGGRWTVAQPSATRLVQYMLNANSSTFDIGGNAEFLDYGALAGGTSTWKFGGNVRFDRTILATGPRAGLPRFNFDNTNVSQTTVLIDGGGDQRLGFSSLLALGNVAVKKTGGSITLLDDLLLKGNFTIDPANSMPGGYDDNGSYLIFKGGIDCETLAQQIDALGADLQKVHIMAGSSTFVKLMSNLVVSDNLDIDAGCKLFLNSFTLTAEGQTITTGQPWDQGEIVAGAPIPEPATLLLLGTGALGVLGWVRRRRMT